jgi:uncharacterized repeat protein (TIGR03803 family)
MPPLDRGAMPIVIRHDGGFLMLRLRTYGFLTFASTRSPKRAKVEKFGFLKRVCMVFVVCGATAIASHAQIYGKVHQFQYAPSGLVQGTDGDFYGTTREGGTSSNCGGGCGTVFKITPAGTLTTLHSFDLTDGAYPEGALVQGTDGNFYGTTNGGVIDNGTVFTITPGGMLTTLHSFSRWSDGAGPNGLVQGTDGNFYGTTSEGAGGTEFCFQIDGCGTVFKITAAGALTTLYSFHVFDGISPDAALVQGTDGDFYGTTSWGGDLEFCQPYQDFDYVGCGTVFKITAAGVLTNLHYFSGTDGAHPRAGLVQGTDGSFYGTTYIGGTSTKCPDEFYNVQGCGTVFKITPAGTLTTLHSFDVTEGAFPQAALVQATDGNFYGTTYSGGGGLGGTVFKIIPGGTLSTLHDFGTVGASGPNALVQSTDGSFYGTTYSTPTFFRLRVFPAVRFSTASFNFGSQALNEVSAIKTVTLTNTGGDTLNINTIGSSSGFSIFSNCEATLAVGAKCWVNVQFLPNVLGKQTGVLTFTDNAFNSPQTVALTGTGVIPVVLTPATAGFNPQAEGTTSPPGLFTLTNNFRNSLNYVVISATGDFAVSSTTCTPPVVGKSKCTISVTFTPTGLGKRTGKLSVSDIASNSPQTSALTGTGAIPATLLPASATYAARAVGTTSPAKTFTLINNQTVALTGIVISRTGDFAVSSTTCTTSLAAKSNCTISVTFRPTAKGTRTGKLTIRDIASSSPQTSTLTGSGT